MALSKKAETVIQAFNRGYRVTEEGDVLSPKGKKRKLQETPKRRKTYLRFSFKRDDGTDSTVNVHQLAAYQKFGDEAFGTDDRGLRLHVRHLDDDPRNNRLDNLAMGTVRDNIMDRSREDRVAHAKKASRVRRKLSDDQVRELRKDHASGMSYKKLKEKYDVAISSISYIINGKMYQEVV